MAPVRELFNITVRPLATPETIGGFYKGFRLIGVDGVIYNVEEIKGMLDGKIENLMFDEAWLPHAPICALLGALRSGRLDVLGAQQFLSQDTSACRTNTRGARRHRTCRQRP